MRKSTIGLSSLIAIAGMALAGAAGSAMPGASVLKERPALPSRAIEVQTAQRRRMLGNGLRPFIGGYQSGPGWGIRQVKRMAAKKRNQARNRAMHRGGR